MSDSFFTWDKYCTFLMRSWTSGQENMKMKWDSTSASVQRCVLCFLLVRLETAGLQRQQETGEPRRAGSQWMGTRVRLWAGFIRNMNLDLSHLWALFTSLSKNLNFFYIHTNTSTLVLPSLFSDRQPKFATVSPKQQWKRCFVSMKM